MDQVAVMIAANENTIFYSGFSIHKSFKNKKQNESKVPQMPKSKLERYEDILSALANKYLSVDTIAFQCNMDCLSVNKRLDFLIQNHLVRESHCNKKILYSLTTRGEAVHKMLPVSRRLNKLKKSTVISENLRTLPNIEKQNENQERSRRYENY